MADAGSDFSTRKQSNEGVFRETTVTQILSGSFARANAQFGADSGSEACPTSKRL